jgi:TonB family protein
LSSSSSCRDKEKARRARFQGTCIIGLVVGEDGVPRNVRITKPLGTGLDVKAVESVSSWRFKPALKDDKPVAVEIEVSFTSNYLMLATLTLCEADA